MAAKPLVTWVNMDFVTYFPKYIGATLICTRKPGVGLRTQARFFWLIVNIILRGAIMTDQKQILSITIRPSLISKIDRLAQQCSLSRSECMGRLLGRICKDLDRPEVAAVWIKKKSLIEDTLMI